MLEVKGKLVLRALCPQRCPCVSFGLNGGLITQRGLDVRVCLPDPAAAARVLLHLHTERVSGVLLVRDLVILAFAPKRTLDPPGCSSGVHESPLGGLPPLADGAIEVLAVDPLFPGLHGRRGRCPVDTLGSEPGNLDEQRVGAEVAVPKGVEGSKEPVVDALRVLPVVLVHGSSKLPGLVSMAGQALLLMCEAAVGIEEHRHAVFNPHGKLAPLEGDACGIGHAGGLRSRRRRPTEPGGLEAG